ncbi:hypothetical protein GZL_08480 [Streptomyces sp. 769]|nr:hypothetical protein GZL_08480 [Streptomyces sp. 769]
MRTHGEPPCGDRVGVMRGRRGALPRTPGTSAGVRAPLRAAPTDSQTSKLRRGGGHIEHGPRSRRVGRAATGTHFPWPECRPVPRRSGAGVQEAATAGGAGAGPGAPPSESAVDRSASWSTVMSSWSGRPWRVVMP